MRKKSAMTIELIITMAILGIVLLVIVGGGIRGILINKQLAFASEKTDDVTKDCDEDNTLGLNDKCPCVFTKQKLEKGESCGTPDAKATTNCPALCKK
ncbi:type II secretion system protein [Candidatus Woesearchaeota archaeon]|nr:type II secretion system protein [Candidatus Woesearchaeota archaeon]